MLAFLKSISAPAGSATAIMAVGFEMADLVGLKGFGASKICAALAKAGVVVSPFDLGVTFIGLSVATAATVLINGTLNALRRRSTFDYTLTFVNPGANEAIALLPTFT